MSHTLHKQYHIWIRCILLIILALFVSGCQDLGITNIPLKDAATEISQDASSYYVEPLSKDAVSNTDKGATKYGATIILGELDEHSRSTFAHIQLKNEQEPGNNDESRNERINVDPIGWRNFKLDGKWANNRCHLIGYQFSGLNDELRNLSIGTSYLNKGTEGNGMDESNPDGMLFYEQRLDAWLDDNPDHMLDYYVKPIYTNNYTTPDAYYMQWVGIKSDGTTIPINIQGHSQVASQSVQYVILKNQSPSYNIDTVTGNITLK